MSTKDLKPDIHVEGDIISKKYDFMMGDLMTNPYKIAQVSMAEVSQWFRNDSEQRSEAS